MAAGCLRERNGYFYVRVRVLLVDPKTGASRWKQTEKAAGTSRRKAEQMLRSLQSEVDEHRFIPTNMTVLQLGRKWLGEHVEPNLRPGAAANYRSTFYVHVAPTLGPVRVDDCGQAVIRALLGRKRAEGLGDATVAKIRRHMHAMFAYAQDAGLVAVNPADAPRARGRKRGQRRARGTQLSPMQVKRLIDECPERWRLFFTIALDTGLRRGELIGLRWGDVDLLDRILYVRRSIGSYDRPHELVGACDERLATKTESSQRLVPILDGAQAALEELYTGALSTDDEAPVFATVERKRGRDGVLRPVGRPLSPRMVTRVFRRYAERAGLPEKVRLHDLRHTAITNAIGQGEDILLVSAFAGHAKASTTVDVYGHLMPDRVREAARRMHSISNADQLETDAETPELIDEDDLFAPEPEPLPFDFDSLELDAPEQDLDAEGIDIKDIDAADVDVDVDVDAEAVDAEDVNADADADVDAGDMDVGVDVSAENVDVNVDVDAEDVDVDAEDVDADAEDVDADVMGELPRPGLAPPAEEDPASPMPRRRPGRPPHEAIPPAERAGPARLGAPNQGGQRRVAHESDLLVAMRARAARHEDPGARIRMVIDPNLSRTGITYRVNTRRDD